MQVLGWIFLALLAVIVLVVLGLVIASAGDIKRYFKIKSM